MTSQPSLIEKVFTHLQHPAEKPHIEHDARLGAALEGAEPAATRDDLTKLIKAQGNNGSGMADGLNKKSIQQQQEVAERARLREEGLFESHLKHEELVNKSEQHRAVADGTNISHQSDD